MGLLDKIWKKPKHVEASEFHTFTEYTPVFSSYNGKIYEQELTRSVIERFAVACSKLKPEIKGNSLPQVVKAINTAPNDFMTWPRFLARLATIFECDTTAYVVPVFDRDVTTIIGLYPLKCEFAEILEFKGQPWIRFTFRDGEQAALEMKYVCILSKFQYISDFFGSGNCIGQTMNLIVAQNEAQLNAIKNGATIRFIGSLTGQVREEDMKKKRERFVKDNLSKDNESGIMLYDQTFSDVKQVEPQSFTIDNSEMQRIKDNVFNYFGINEDILQNKHSEDQWSAWYEGRIEPFAVQLGEGLTNMLFSQREQHTNEITFSSNRLQYASNASKRNMIRDMLDRGVISLNEAREILQLPPVDGGDIRVIRGEYVNTDSVSALSVSPEEDATVDEHDLTKKDSDKHGSKDETDAD